MIILFKRFDIFDDTWIFQLCPVWYSSLNRPVPGGPNWPSGNLYQEGVEPDCSIALIAVKLGEYFYRNIVKHRTQWKNS